VNTVFEIGSITKAFIGLLLADMVARGEVRLHDPVQRYLPPGVTVPARGGREITLRDR
jgi:CubicO group peptidase (beta-lactamase class C family)